MPSLAAAWVRAVGEFGIVMIFAWFPQGIPAWLYTNLQNDGVDTVYTLVWLPLTCFAFSRRKAAH